MSIFDDIGDVAKAIGHGAEDVLDSADDTAKSFGKMAAAPLGAVWDLSTFVMPNSKQGSFGDLFHGLAADVGDALDPFLNDKTWTGAAVGGLFNGLNTAWHEGVQQPFVTAQLMGAHAWATGDPGSVLSGQDWAKAYQQAEHMNIGQGLLTSEGAQIQRLAGKNAPDPFATKDGNTPFDESIFGNSAVARAAAGTADFAIMWALDPAVVGGKVAGLARQKYFLGKIGAYDQLGFGSKVGAYGDEAEKLGIPLFDASKKLTNRVDGHFDFISGDNKIGRKLSGPEVYATSPELRRSTNGRQIAQLMSDAAHLDDPIQARLAYKRVVAVAAGDPTAIRLLRDQSAVGRAIADQLTSMANGGPLDLKTQALNEMWRFDPKLHVQFKSQLDDLNAVNGDIDKFVSGWSKRLDAELAVRDRSLDTAAMMDFLPGAHGNGPLGALAPIMGRGAGDQALKRITGTRAIDKIAAKHDEALARFERLARNPAATSVWQKGLNTLPLTVMRPIGKVAGIYTKGPKVALDALRQVHFTGVLDTHAWDDSLDQIDAYMRIAKVPTEVRNATLADAAKASTEAEKYAIKQRVEHLGLTSVMDHYSHLTGKKVDSDYVAQVVGRYGNQTRASLDALHGQQYATTLIPDEMLRDPLYAGPMRAAREQADEAFSRGQNSFGFEADPHAHWRVDQVDEEGNLISVPVLSSQMMNKMPMIDISLVDKAMRRDSGVLHGHLADLSSAWKQQAAELDGALRARARLAGAKGADRLDNTITNLQKSMDWLLEAGGVALRVWKWGVLFRLGYPMRVVADDQMRIGTQIGWATEFVAPNAAEASRNAFFNKAPSWVYKDGRKGAALRQWHQDRVNYRTLRDTTGVEGLSREDLHAIDEAVAARRGGDSEAISKADETIARLDPHGLIAPHFDRQRDIDGLSRSIAGIQGHLTRLRNEGAPASKIAKAEEKLTSKTSERDVLLSQQLPTDPHESLSELEALSERIKGGWKSYLGDKRKIGMGPVKIPVSGSKEYLTANGAYGGDEGLSVRQLAGSEQSFHENFYGPETSYGAHLRAGKYDTLTPGTTPDEAAAHLRLWSDVLNHQVRNAPELMWLLRHPDATADDFRAFLRNDRPDIAKRVQHFSRNPEDWYGRLRPMLDDLVPSEELRKALIESKRVTPDALDRMFPVREYRPPVHGQVVANNSSIGVGRVFSRVYEQSYKWLGSVPTDVLSRHPFFNAMYKRELTRLANVAKREKEMSGGTFTGDDLREWESIARKKALGHLKRTLWDISAHSHAAHVMRFLSPFFAAHQEAMMRWWRIVQDDPSVVRKFQMAFDAPRRAGLVYDTETGEPVKPGESISANHNIILRVPVLGENSGLNKWLKKMGGGHFFEIRENGLNVILQNGITNPGTGPLVTMPVDAIAREYANDAEIQRAAHILNPYPQDSLSASVQPAWMRKLFAVKAAISGDTGNYLYSQRFDQNQAELITQFRINHQRNPSSTELAAIMDKAGKHATRDMMLMALSNIAGFTPATPSGKYAAVQQGWQRILTSMEAQGKDFEWARDQFNKKYGAVYDALIYSTSLNPLKLTGTAAEVGAIKRYKGLIGSLDDPRIGRIVVGPAAAQSAKDDPASGKYSTLARQWLAHANVAPGSDTKFLDQKDPATIARTGLVQSGWDTYDEAMNSLRVAADSRGLDWNSDQVKAARQAAVAQIGQGNQLWLNEYNDRSFGSGNYDKWLVDLRKVASSRQLTGDTERQDVQVLQQYLNLRDSLTTFLAQRKAQGLTSTTGAKELQPIFSAFASAVSDMTRESTYFANYAYDGLIEFDPYIRAGSE